MAWHFKVEAWAAALRFAHGPQVRWKAVALHLFHLTGGCQGLCVCRLRMPQVLWIEERAAADFSTCSAFTVDRHPLFGLGNCGTGHWRKYT